MVELLEASAEASACPTFGLRMAETRQLSNFGVVSLLLHFVADSGSSVGLPLLLPFSNKRFSLYLWADTGHSGWFAFRSTYQQAWTWVTEGGMFVVLAARFYQLRVWPFS